MTGPRITLRIDRIVTDQRLTREEVKAAFESELLRIVQTEGIAALGGGRNLARTAGRIETGKASLANRAAAAAIKATMS